MLSKILPYMRCPRCKSPSLGEDSGGLICTGCQSRYLQKDGILDMIGDSDVEFITPFQRLMQAPLVVAVYEKLWRKTGYFIASSRPFSREVKTVLRLSGGRTNDRILDLACGTGIFTRPLARHGGGFVVGLDMSLPMLTRAQHLMQSERIRNIQFIRATVFSMPFINGAFPLVNCCGALHLFDRPIAALREIRRILESGGHLCVQTTIRPLHSAGMAFILERFIRFGFFEELELVEKLELLGFRLMERERHRISYTFLAQLAGKVAGKNEPDSL